tara:strand:+ start:50 stop:340 length:291 start_codon:yes stop_codon:yes gene_type:complete
MSKYTPRTVGELTRTEKNWIDGLMRSNLDLSEPFSAVEAKVAVVTTPTKKGTHRKISPSNYKMAYVLRKAPGFTVAYVDAKKRPMFVYEGQTNLDE